VGNTFAQYVRSFMRHDPEVIMIGEIRDSETAELAFRAAQTGHLVLSTLHTNDALGAVTRLKDLGVDKPSGRTRTRWPWTRWPSCARGARPSTSCSA